MARFDVHLKQRIHIHYLEEGKLLSGFSRVKYIVTAQNKFIKRDFLIKPTMMIKCLPRIMYYALQTGQ